MQTHMLMVCAEQKMTLFMCLCVCMLGDMAFGKIHTKKSVFIFYWTSNKPIRKSGPNPFAIQSTRASLGSWSWGDKTEKNLKHIVEMLLDYFF